MNNRKVYLLLLLFCTLSVYGQEAEEKPLRSIFSSTMLELGKERIYDNYLSQIRYSGFQIGISNERMQIAKFGKGKFTNQQLMGISFATTENAAGNGNTLSGFIDYGYGTFYTLKPAPSLKILAGGVLSGAGGFIYNTRNSNNPASAKIDVNLNLSAMAIWSFRIGRQSVAVRYQFVVPVAGVFFSPQFGESYYEIFDLENHDGIVHFGSFHNQFNLLNLLTVDIPIHRFGLRLGYRNKIRSTHVNDITTQLYDHNFIIGISTEFVPLRRGRTERVKQTVLNAFY